MGSRLNDVVQCTFLIVHGYSYYTLYTLAKVNCNVMQYSNVLGSVMHATNGPPYHHAVLL